MTHVLVGIVYSALFSHLYSINVGFHFELLHQFAGLSDTGGVVAGHEAAGKAQLNTDTTTQRHQFLSAWVLTPIHQTRQHISFFQYNRFFLSSICVPNSKTLHHSFKIESKCGFKPHWRLVNNETYISVYYICGDDTLNLTPVCFNQQAGPLSFSVQGHFSVPLVRLLLKRKT